MQPYDEGSGAKQTLFNALHFQPISEASMMVFAGCRQVGVL